MSVSALVSYDSPSVSSIIASNGPLTGLVSLTLVGSGFGFWDYSTMLRVGFTDCLGHWCSDSSAVCSLRPGRRAGHDVVVSISRQVGSFTEAFIYDGPALSSSLPANAPLSGRVSFTVTGKNLGVTDYSQKLRVGGTACDTEWESDTTVKCKLGLGAQMAYENCGGTLEVRGCGLAAVVTVGERFYTLPRALSFDLPMTSSLLPFNGPTSGLVSVSVSGGGFGAIFLREMCQNAI